MTKGKIYITGGSDGLGLALGQILVEAGYNVTSLSRTKPTDTRLDHIAMDLTDEASIERTAEIIARGGAVMH